MSSLRRKSKFKRGANGGGDAKPVVYDPHVQDAAAHLRTTLFPLPLHLPLDDQPLAATAADAFERSFEALFRQAVLESDRLPRLNAAIQLIELRLLNPETILSMAPDDLSSLLNTLHSNASTSVGILSQMTNLAVKMRSLDAIIKGLHEMAAIQSEKPETEKVLKHEAKREVAKHLDS